MLEELRYASWWDEEDDGNWDYDVLESVSNILGIDEDTLIDMVVFVFNGMENGGHSPYEFVEDFENIKREYEEEWI